jgi:hypothetical protein
LKAIHNAARNDELFAPVVTYYSFFICICMLFNLLANLQGLLLDCRKPIELYNIEIEREAGSNYS